MTSKVRDEDIAALKSAGRFDSEWYCKTYPDVAYSGMDPAEHFLWIGAKLGRSPLPPTTAIGSARATLDVLFVDGTNGSSSTTYRISRVAQALSENGLKIKCVNGDDLSRVGVETIPRYVTFFRAPFWSDYREFAERMRSRGAKIVFDIDDLVFEESLIPHIDGYRFLTDEEKVGYVRGVRAYRDFILYADFCTAATEFLAARIRSLGKKAYWVRNTLDSEEIERFRGSAGKTLSDQFVVGYYSGSKTHQADFRNAGAALLQFMDENPRVAFRLVGKFDLDEYPDFDRWSEGPDARVTHVGLMPHSRMIEDQRRCDLIIAPLEVGNPFCEAKSELKFFEASLVRRPIIASPTRTFANATRDGQYGQLADTPEEWLAAYRRAFESFDQMQDIALSAQAYVIQEYAIAAAGRDALHAYAVEKVSRQATAPIASRGAPSVPNAALSIAVIIPEVPEVSGGHRKIFALCKALEDAGYRISLYVYSDETPDVILDRIRAFYTDINPKVVNYRGYIGAHDIALCTHWLTAYDMRNSDAVSQVIYFVQDFEPMFFPAGTGYIKALTTYSMGYDIVCYGEWVAAKLKEEVGVRPKVIPFVLDHSLYKLPKKNVRRDVDVLFFARPTQDRRCYEIIIEGLTILKNAQPNLRIGLFGEAFYPGVAFDHVNYGAVNDLKRLAELYHRSKLGICFSTTNPSQLGYEMVACGVVLVDVKIKYSELNFGGDEFVRYCLGTPESVSEACIDLLADDAELNNRQTKGVEYALQMADDLDLGRSFLRICNLVPKSA